MYNTDVIDTDYTSWLILLHCSDPESEKKFLSTFVLSRTAYIDRTTTEYLREKIGNYNVPMEYLFSVNQTFCFGEDNFVGAERENQNAENPSKLARISTTTSEPEVEGENNYDSENENYANGESDTGKEMSENGD